MDASSRRLNWLKYMTLLSPWPWTLDLQNVVISSVASATSSTKVWWNSVHWFVRYHANSTHARTDARTETRTRGRTTRKHHAASDTPIGWRRCKYVYNFRRLRSIVLLLARTWTWVGSTHGLGWVEGCTGYSVPAQLFPETRHLNRIIVVHSLHGCGP